MREFKIFIVVVIFTGIVYWGVEPFAASQHHHKVNPADFNYAKEDATYFKTKIDAAKANVARLSAALKDAKDKKIATNELEQAKANLAAQEKESIQYATLWARADKIAAIKGDAKKGKELFSGGAMCAGCHGLKAEGMPDPITNSSMFGVTPPDLSDAGNLYTKPYLAALILDPAMALKVTHKFGPNRPFPMTAYAQTGDKVTDNTSIADVIAYLVEVGKVHDAKFDKDVKAKLEAKYKKDPNKDALIAKAFTFAKDKDAFANACGRCHDMSYNKFKATSSPADLKKYLGSVPPDLSMMIRSRGPEYLEIFINDPQKELHGTAMPRVGVNEASEAKIISYMSQVGDSKKEIRDHLGVYIIVYFLILSLFAYGWKHKVWSKLH